MEAATWLGSECDSAAGRRTRGSKSSTFRIVEQPSGNGMGRVVRDERSDSKHLLHAAHLGKRRTGEIAETGFSYIFSFDFDGLVPAVKDANE